MAVGTPEELERSVRGRKTVIQLRRVNDAILDALKRLQVRNMVREGNKLMVDVVNPEEENPAIVNAIVAAGGRIETVSVTRLLAGRCIPETREGDCSMTDWMPWKIARKEMKVIRRKRASSTISSCFPFSSPFFSQSSSRDHNSHPGSPCTILAWSRIDHLLLRRLGGHSARFDRGLQHSG